MFVSKKRPFGVDVNVRCDLNSTKREDKIEKTETGSAEKVLSASKCEKEERERTAAAYHKAPRTVNHMMPECRTELRSA